MLRAEGLGARLLQLEEPRTQQPTKTGPANCSSRFGRPTRPVIAPMAVRGSRKICANPANESPGKRIARIMQENSLQAVQRRRFKVTTQSDHDYPVTPNLLERPVQGRTTELRLGRRHHLHPDRGGVAVPRSANGSVLKTDRRLEHLEADRSLANPDRTGRGASHALSSTRSRSSL